MGLGRKRKGQNRKYSDKKAKGSCKKNGIYINDDGNKPPAIQLGGNPSDPADMKLALAKISSFLETVQDGPKEILRQNVIRNLSEMERRHVEEKETESEEKKDDFEEVLRAIQGHIGHTPTESDYAFQYEDTEAGEEEKQHESEDDSGDSDYEDEGRDTERHAAVEEIPLEEDEEMQYQDFQAYSTFGRTNNVISSVGNKLAIACFYMNALNAPPDEFWKGKNGVINRILNVFQIRNLGYYVWVRDILQAVRECIVSDKEYTGQLPKKRRGRTHILSTDSEEAKLLAASMEKGLGIRHATWRVNTYRDLRGEEVVGQTCVFGLF